MCWQQQREQLQLYGVRLQCVLELCVLVPLGPCWVLSKHNINCTGNNLFTFVLIVRKCPKNKLANGCFCHHCLPPPLLLRSLCVCPAQWLPNEHWQATQQKLQLLLCFSAVVRCCSNSDKFRTHHRNNKIVRLRLQGFCQLRPLTAFSWRWPFANNYKPNC